MGKMIEQIWIRKTS